MHELDDNALLREYSEQNSEAAFAALVERHVDKVYSVALRHTRNNHAAEEITQAVFVILAKKSGRLGAKVILAGWLYETARLTALTYIRSEIRRAHREQEAHMQTALNENDADLSRHSGATAEAWPHIAPLLDDALAKLSAADRHAVVLRYFDGKSLGEVGAALGASEDAAKKRVTRAVDKLRSFFTKRGVTLTATVLTAAISANSVQAAPLGLAATVAATAAKGAVVSGSTLTLIKGALKIMAWTKMKTAVVVCVAMLLAASTTTVVIKQIVSPSVDESLWSVNSENFAKAPSVLIIRPTRFPSRSGMVDMDKKVIGLNLPISSLFVRAYDFDFGANRMILPPDVQRQHYDLMLTLSSHESESLREKIKTQLGLVARREMRETDVLLLKVRDTAMLEPKISKGGSPVGYMTSDISFGRMVITNQPISVLAHQLEGLLPTTTIDQTGLTNNFDINLKWNRNDPQHNSLKQALLNQLGLELVPSRELVEMLVVEKVK